ncbi:extracellular solute-binding protein [Alcaligenaceae bacterium SJ-26]|nr:extracellular solute-binding protein [Alcaligenaceae bacterium SJ-26]
MNNHSKFHRLPHAARLWRQISVACAGLFSCAVVQAAPVDIQVWHSLSNANRAEFEELVKQYNKEQDNVHVSLKGFETQAALQGEAGAAVAAKQAPNLIQLDDEHSPEVTAQHRAILPLHTLLSRNPLPDSDWFLSQTAGFTRDRQGRLLAFPWMAEVPLMFYNRDLFVKAGLNPNAPARTWSELQAQLLALRDSGVMCPYATSKQVSVHLENLAPVNNQLYSANNNGFGNGVPALQFNVLYARHLALMSSWTKSMLLTMHSNDQQPDDLFASGQCGVLTSGSGAVGAFLAAPGLSFGVAPLPYYPQATSTPGAPFVSGSAFWAVAGHGRDQERAVVDFLGWLAKPVNAARWHQQTGFLPLTEAAFRASDVSYYDRIPGAQSVVNSLSGRGAQVSRSFRLPHYAQARVLLDRELNAALQDGVPPSLALSQAASQANSVMQRR